MFDVPALKSGQAWEARVHLFGEAGLTGPDSATTVATLSVFSAPREGTLSGTALQRGNIGGDLLATKGHYACHVVMRPIVHRFELPPVVEDVADGGLESAASEGISGLLLPARAAPAAPPEAQMERRESEANGEVQMDGLM